MDYGSKDIYTMLSTNSSISSLVDDISQGLIPKDLGKKISTINFYRSTPIDTALPFNSCTYTVNCRAENYSKSETIADTVISELNRVYNDNYFVTFDKLPVIFPQDETDNFNSIVELKIRNT